MLKTMWRQLMDLFTPPGRSISAPSTPVMSERPSSYILELGPVIEQEMLALAKKKDTNLSGIIRYSVATYVALEQEIKEEERLAIVDTASQVRAFVTLP